MTSPADEPLGLLLVDKPGGVTSHDVVGRVRAILRTRRVGHAGTLDPMATGLLVVAVGRATKLLGHLALTTKSYTATIRLGVTTDTDDADGQVVASADASRLTAAEIGSAIAALTGQIDQVPSSFSAVKVDGRRAYDRARAGEQVLLAARPVTVSGFRMVSPPVYDATHVDIAVAVDCSAGTYIRALARDLGAALGVGGHLTVLRRHRVGPFAVDGAINVFPDGVTARGEPRPPVTEELRQNVVGSVIPVGRAARIAFAVREATDREAADLRHGRPIGAVGIDGCYAVLDVQGDLLALVEDAGAIAKPVLVWQAG